MVRAWKGASRRAAEEVFEGCKGRVLGMGGLRAWRENGNGRGGSWGWGWDEERKGEDGEGEGEEVEENVEKDEENDGEEEVSSASLPFSGLVYKQKGSHADYNGIFLQGVYYDNDATEFGH